MKKALLNSKDYKDNWEQVFSKESKLKQKQSEEILLEKERLYSLELKKKEDLEKNKQIKLKIKKLL